MGVTKTERGQVHIWNQQMRSKVTRIQMLWCSMRVVYDKTRMVLTFEAFAVVDLAGSLYLRQRARGKDETCEFHDYSMTASSMLQTVQV